MMGIDVSVVMAGWAWREDQRFVRLPQEEKSKRLPYAKWTLCEKELEYLPLLHFKM